MVPSPQDINSADGNVPTILDHCTPENNIALSPSAVSSNRGRENLSVPRIIPYDNSSTFLRTKNCQGEPKVCTVVVARRGSCPSQGPRVISELFLLGSSPFTTQSTIAVFLPTSPSKVNEISLSVSWANHLLLPITGFRALWNQQMNFNFSAIASTRQAPSDD